MMENRWVGPRLLVVVVLVNEPLPTRNRLGGSAVLVRQVILAVAIHHVVFLLREGQARFAGQQLGDVPGLGRQFARGL